MLNKTMDRAQEHQYSPFRLFIFIIWMLYSFCGDGIVPAMRRRNDAKEMKCKGGEKREEKNESLFFSFLSSLFPLLHISSPSHLFSFALHDPCGRRDDAMVHRVLKFFFACLCFILS